MAAAKYWERGEALDYNNGSGSKIDANTIVVLTAGAAGRIGVVGTDIPNGAVGSVHVTGVFQMPKSSSNAITQGTAVYWDGTGVTEDSNDGGGTPTYYPSAGFAAYDAAAADETILVKIG
jgi:predicted RecA/RadA family phage recombinase